MNIKLTFKKTLCIIFSLFMMTACKQAPATETVESNVPKVPVETETIEKNVDEKFQEADMSHYYGMEGVEEHNFVTADFNTIFNTIKGDGTCYLFFGYSECPGCNAVLPFLTDIATKENIYIIYLDAFGSEMTGDNVKKLLDEIPEFTEENGDILTPHLFAFKDGSVVDHFSGTVGDITTDEETNKAYLSAENEKLYRDRAIELVNSIR